MEERKRVYHGQRKWVCPKCRNVIFQKIKKNRSGRVDNENRG